MAWKQVTVSLQAFPPAWSLSLIEESGLAANQVKIAGRERAVRAEPMEMMFTVVQMAQGSDFHFNKLY